jgi:coenzyme F420 hydrogenase subunit beta
VSAATFMELAATVVANGCCIGCGACAVSLQGVAVHQDPFGRYQAVDSPSPGGEPAKQRRRESSSACPFGDDAASEDEIAREVFGGDLSRHPALGLYLDAWAGSVGEGSFQACGSSGGTATWICTELLTTACVDAVISVGAARNSASRPTTGLFEFRIARTPEDVRASAKSKYYPVELSEVLREVRDGPEIAYAVVALPCFIKAVRLLAGVDPVIRRRVKYCIGLVCGHLKSSAFADMLGWQCGIEPGNLTSIDFRVKNEKGRADRYSIAVAGYRGGRPVAETKPNSEFYGQLWGLGFFKYEACDYCDDVFAETADISVGDAWLPRYVDDPRGTNILVVRDSRLRQLVLAATSEGRLRLDPLAPDDAARSQDAGLRHRREGLAYRLYLRARDERWAPRKRVRPCGEGSSGFRRTHELRMQLAAESHLAFQSARAAHDLEVFTSRMDPVVAAYEIAHSHLRRHIAANLVRRVFGQPV